MKQRKRLKKIGSWLLKTTVVVFITLCIVETVYRYQWIDFYSGEWAFQNPVRIPDKQQTRVLVFGDSYSADTGSWVGKWQKIDSMQVFNAALPGTGPETVRLIAPNRIAATDPDVVIVQLYEGNDLYDLRKPVNWGAHSVFRNLYWGSSNVFRSLGFINYRLGQSKADVTTTTNPKHGESFRKNRYDARTRLYIRGNPNYPSDMVLLKDDFKQELASLADMLTEIRTEARKAAAFYVVIVPSCVQVHRRYLRHYNWLGARNDTAVLTQHPWADFLRKRGFQVIDPITAFRKAEQNGQRLYYSNDPHLNAAGQQLLLDYVQRTIAL